MAETVEIDVTNLGFTRVSDDQLDVADQDSVGSEAADSDDADSVPAEDLGI